MTYSDPGDGEVRTDIARSENVLPLRTDDEQRFRSFAWIVFAVALTARLAYLYSIRDIPFLNSPTVDGRFYDHWAQRIAAGAWWSGDVFFLAPTYPYVLAILYSLFGRNLALVHVVQMLWGAGACALIFHAGRRFFNERTGLIAGLLMALYPPAIFFDGIIHKASLLFLLTALFLFFLSSTTRPGRTWLTCGLISGLLALTQENMLLLLLVVPIWIFFRIGKEPRRVRWRHAATFLGGMTVLLAVVAVRNYAVGSVLALTTSNVGQNFFVGNNAAATGLYESFYRGRQDPVQEREDAIRIAESTLGRKLTPGQASTFWFQRGLEFVREQPRAWLRLLLRKVFLVWNRFEIPDAEDIAVYAEWSGVFGIPARLFHFGVLAPLGLAGIVLTWNRWRELWILYLLLPAITASLSVFFVFARFRLPLAPLLALLGGAGLVALVAPIRIRRVRSLLVAAGVLILSAWATNRRLLDEKAYQSVGFVNLGSLLRQQGRLDEADRFLRRAIECYEDGPLAYYQLGLVDLKRDRRTQAEANLSRACALEPNFADPQLALARMYVEQGRAEEAVARYRQAVRLKPDEETPRLELARLLEPFNRGNDEGVRDELRRLTGVIGNQESSPTDDVEALLRKGTDAAAAGRFAEAIQAYQKVLERRPDDAKVHLALAGAYTATERWSEAVKGLQRAVELEPNLIQAHIELGRILVDQGKVESAIAHDQRALTLDPGSIPARYNLSTALATMGRLDEAIAAMEVCLEQARTAQRTELIPRIEDRLTRLRAQRNSTVSP